MIYELKAVQNEKGYYDIVVNDEVVCGMLVQEEIAEAVEYILKDPHGFVRDMIPAYDY